MTPTKIYINVPFAQKDEAKALGARWDAAQKRWYVLEDKDLSLFSKWSTTSVATEKVNAISVTAKTTTISKNSNDGTITIAQHKDFVAYNGELPPWN